MPTKWTKEQLEVINTRKKNILVSAAAGSGKTAVLVERIIKLITDEENPIDIDTLLVVTFTKAAAAQMKERIGKALAKLCAKNKDNKHLQKQRILLHEAKIQTIHSFCLDIIRDYYHLIDLDPVFRVGEEAEINMIKDEVLSELFEKYYEAGSEDFYEFIECFSSDKSNVSENELIKKLYEISVAQTNPKEWLDYLLKLYDIDENSDLDELLWIKNIIKDIEVKLESALNVEEEALVLCNNYLGPKVYIDNLLNDIEIINELKKNTSYTAFYKAFSNAKFSRLSTKKEKIDEADKIIYDDNKEKVKQYRNTAKKIIEDLQKKYFFQEPCLMLADIIKSKQAVTVFINMTKDFIDLFNAKKREKKVLDFNDIEQMALRILENDVVKSEYATKFNEIMVDEYQDSNDVQDTILKAVSKESIGRFNRFMVGDVKQSIYKFRQAKPEIFIDKYSTYSLETENNSLIELNKNFRSREQVLTFINEVFDKIMLPQIGGIDYDEKACLYPGASFPNNGYSDIEDYIEVINVSKSELTTNKIQNNNNINQNKNGDDTAIQGSTDDKNSDNYANNSVNQGMNEPGKDSNDNKASSQDDENFDESEELELENIEYEATVIAEKIKNLVKNDPKNVVYDGDLGAYRPTKYSDIVILLRSLKDKSDKYLTILNQAGIPAYCEKATGYFSATEVVTILNYLRMLDNPLVDIPTLSILMSPIGQLNAEDIAKIRLCADRKVPLYKAAREYLKLYETSSVKVNVDESNENYKLIESQELICEETCNEQAQRSDEENILSCETVDKQDNSVSKKDKSLNSVQDETVKKLGKFFDIFDKLKEKTRILSIDQLLREIYQKTGYYYYAYASKQGEKAAANLDMLIQKAIEFNKTSYHGLFHFVRYIDKLNKYEIDYGESMEFSDNNAVRIMSIHKSKGLEFPIVILANANAGFNKFDERAKILIHPQLGLGPECIDYKLRTKIPTIIKQSIANDMLKENLGEILRVLYVALTRAKEKLIITSFVKGEYKKAKAKWEYIANNGQDKLRSVDILGARNFLDLLMPALIKSNRENLVKNVTPENIINEQVEKVYELYNKCAKLDKNHFNEEIDKMISDYLNYTYPFEDDVNQKMKFTVSELKKQSQVIESKETLSASLIVASNDIILDGSISIKNADIASRTGKKNLASLRGTVYHRIFEHIPFDADKLPSGKELIDKLILEGILTSDNAKLIDDNKIDAFLSSELASRMRKASLANKLYREKPFVIGVDASEIYPNTKSKELLLVQGVVDAYFVEDDEIVLVDYKTDRVSSLEELVERYKKQLYYYEKALTQVTGKKVKEKIIYSVYLYSSQV